MGTWENVKMHLYLRKYLEGANPMHGNSAVLLECWGVDETIQGIAGVLLSPSYYSCIGLFITGMCARELNA